MKSEAMKNLGVRLTASDFENLGLLAEENGETISDAVRKIISLHFEISKKVALEKVEHEATRSLIRKLFEASQPIILSPLNEIDAIKLDQIDWLNVLDEFPKEAELFRGLYNEATTDIEKTMVEDLLRIRITRAREPNHAQIALLEGLKAMESFNSDNK